MTLEGIFAALGGGGGIGVILLVLLTLVEIAPIQVNPWKAIGKWFGNVINGEVLHKVGEVKEAVIETQTQLNEHIRIDDERDADLHRQNILRFNTDLLRDIKHTEEDFSEILSEIDYYERYCESHPNYRNNRAVHAIKNIEKVYDVRMEKHDFL